MSGPDRVLAAGVGGALLMLAAAGWLLLAPALDGPAAADGTDLLLGTPAPTASVAPVPTTPATIVVDVAGAVAEPGIRMLPAGSRVGDAIAAAGGYASDADLDAAAASLNLAQALADGEQVRVPRVGEAAAAAPAAGATAAPASGAGAGGLVNLNTATPEQLEALPGIGPVTVQKIVAARQEQPFASLDDALQRGIIHRGQLADIQGLATAP